MAAVQGLPGHRPLVAGGPAGDEGRWRSGGRGLEGAFPRSRTRSTVAPLRGPKVTLANLDLQEKSSCIHFTEFLPGHGTHRRRRDPQRPEWAALFLLEKEAMSS